MTGLARVWLVAATLLVSCSGSRAPQAQSNASSSAGGSCRSEADCVLASRGELGCCTMCSELEPMSLGERDETARLCGLHNGSETCPPMEAAECPAEDPGSWRAACVSGHCHKLAAGPAR